MSSKKANKAFIGNKGIGGKSIGKKGVFFTLTAILIVGIIFAWYSKTEIVTGADKISLTRLRVEKTDDIVRDINTNYMQRISRVASYNALSAIANYEIQQEKFMTQGEFECALKTVPLYGALLNGTWLEPFGAGKDLYFETSPDLASNSNTGGNFREYFGAGAGVVSTLAQGFQPTSTDSLHNATFRFCTVLPGNKKVVIQIRDQECGRPGPRILAED